MTKRRRQTPKSSARADSPPRGSTAPGRPTSSDRLRPWLLAATVALFVARVLFPSESADVHGDGLSVVMLWVVVAVFWLLGVIGRNRFSLRFGRTDVAVLVLIALYSVSALWAAQHASPRPAINMMWQWTGFALAFFLARQFILTAREARATVAVMIALAVTLSVDGLYEYTVDMPATRAQYRADPDAAMRDAGLWFPPGSPERELFEKRLESTEPLATFALTNSLAGYLTPWLIVTVGIGVVGVGAGGWLRSDRLKAFACSLPIAVCLVLTKSRSGYVATAFGLCVVLYFYGRQLGIMPGFRLGAMPTLAWACRKPREACPRKRGHGTQNVDQNIESNETTTSNNVLHWKLPLGLATAVVALVAAAIAFGGLDRQVFSEAGKSLGYRLQYWQATARMIAEHPWLGCGPGNFQNEYTRFKLPEASEEVSDPHNFLLEVWATAGTPALLALLAVLGFFFATVWQLARRKPSGESTASNTSSIDEKSNTHRNPDHPAETTDAWPFALVGGMAGLLLSIPLGLMSTAPPGLSAVGWGILFGSGTVALMASWIRQGDLPRWLIATGVVVLLVNLLAAGGIGFPGVAGTLWLLMAVGLRGDGVHSFARPLAVALLVAGMLLAAACYQTAYSPVIRCRGQLRTAQSHPNEAAKYLLAAAEADPRSEEAQQQLAALALAQWHHNPTPQGFVIFEQHCRRMLELAPNASAAWFAAGQWYDLAHRTSGNAKHLDQAIAHYRRAVELYPNNSTQRARLALALTAADHKQEARQEAEAALRLDGQTPHADKRLPKDLNSRMRQLLDSL